MATATTTGGTSTDWHWIDMFDERNGWGRAGRSLLSTTDGGVRWEDVTPQRILNSNSISFSAFFLDASTCWVSIRFENPHLVLFRTTDGGRTWESITTPLYQGELFFADPENGWFLSGESCGVGHCDGIIYRTTDGGDTWEPTHSFGPSPEDDPNAIPFWGIKDSITFSDPNHGWLTGNSAVPDFVYLFATKDGGITWQHQDIQGTPGAESGHAILDSPSFFTAQEGVLPVFFLNDPPVFSLYLTRDGGAIWQETTGIEKSDYRTIYDCASLQDCWVVDGETLMVSRDGAQTWAEIIPNIRMGGVWYLEFVSSSTGWALSREENGKDQLFRTEDGGLTWVLQKDLVIEQVNPFADSPGVTGQVSLSQTGQYRLDISEPGQPQTQGGVVTGDHTPVILVDGNYIYPSGKGLTVVDVFDPQAPRQVAYLPGLIPAMNMTYEEPVPVVDPANLPPFPQPASLPPFSRLPWTCSARWEWPLKHL